MRENDWTRDDRELDRVLEVREKEEKEDGLERPSGKEKKNYMSYMRVKFLGEYDLIEKMNHKIGDECEVVEWLANIWIEKGYVVRV